MFETPKLVRRLLGLFSTTAGIVGQYGSQRVYRKVLTASAGPNASTVDIAHGLTLADVDVLKVSVILRKASDKTYVFGPVHLSDTIAHSLTTVMGATNVSLTSGSGGDYSGYAVKVVLEYALDES